jgi:hypothetical protein
MQFQVLISFFFAYIAAVQASPVQLPNLPTESITAIELPNIPRGLPIVDGVVSSVGGVVSGAVSSVDNVVTGVVESLPVELPDVAGLVPVSLEDLALPIPVPRDVTEILDTVPLPVPEDATKTLKDAALSVHNTLPAFNKRQEESLGTLSGLIAPVKGIVAPVVDGVLYEAAPVVGVVGAATPQLTGRQLDADAPVVPSTEGILPGVKQPEVPSIPEVPSLPNGVPPVPISKREIEVPKVSAPKMVRVRRQAPGCAEKPARRSLDNIPSIPDSATASTPSIPSVPSAPSTPSTPALA